MLHPTYPIPTLTATWSNTSGYQQSIDRWTAYLNQLAQSAIQPLLAELLDPLPVRSATSRSSQTSQWSCVTGTPLKVGDDRWLLLPTEQIDDDSISIPQEWLDIPEWAVQTIVAIEVNPDEAETRIIGYTTPAEIKAHGHYQSFDRSYGLDREHWITDLSVFQLLQTEGILAAPRTLAALPPLAIDRARHLIDRLATVLQPRLEVPFQTWAALIQNPGWRQQFHQQRQTGVSTRSMAQGVSQWMQSNSDTFGDSLLSALGWQRMAPLPIAVRGNTPSSPQLIKPLNIQDKPYELRLRSIDDQTWQFELHPEAGQMIPQGFTLRLLTEDLQPFEGNESIASTEVAMIYITVELEPGEALVWEIEPEPEDFDRELIHF